MTALVRSPEVPTPPSQSTRTRNAPGERFAPTFVAVLTAAVLVFSVALRFWTPSPMWLDEALTVDIARAPLHLIPGLLRHDGAPPLYYVLLHFWMKVFGTSDLGARSLSGVIGVLTLPAAWVAGYRIGAQSWREHANVPGEASLDGTVPAADRDRAGRLVAWTVTLLVGTSPFAVYYDTEARMYSLVILLSTLGVLAIVAVLARPTIWNTLALAIITCALEYSHYWALFLVATTALGTAWFAWRDRAPAVVASPWRHFSSGPAVLSRGCRPWRSSCSTRARHGQLRRTSRPSSSRSPSLPGATPTPGGRSPLCSLFSLCWVLREVRLTAGV